jgi:RNA polymerase subunit RPABC4/transcription elongation factor Spt4
MIINPVDIAACSKCGVVNNSKKKECPVCKNGASDLIDFKNK